jgi:hypothetical protein
MAVRWAPPANIRSPSCPMETDDSQFEGTQLEAERAEKERRSESSRSTKPASQGCRSVSAGWRDKEVLSKQSDKHGHSTVPSSDEIEQWSQWVLEQADRIDPASPRFLKAMQDEEAS